jgi:hypothetical protein
MPTVTIAEGYKIIVFVNDHPPPHVHVRKNGAQIKVMLTPISYSSARGEPAPQQVRRAVELVSEHLAACLAVWEKHHGD